MGQRTNRRGFLRYTALAGAGVWVAERSGWAQSKSPNEKLNIAAVGCGGKGASDVNCCAGENIVALCDVDERRAAGIFGKYPKARRYKDFRRMLDKEQKNIDAVIVSTPDHTHAPAGIMAMKMGKHLYCQKPLTHSVYEARLMRETAKKMGVATQMGNQGTAVAAFREAVEVVQSGAIGDVSEAHVWSNRPIWNQGWSAILGHKGVQAALHGKGKPAEPPSALDWDLWLGPAPFRPYDPIYVPFAWRGWWDFGTGALGDMACHTVNLPFRALKLEYPTSIEADVPYVNAETPAEWSRITFQFPARGDLVPVKMVWYDGTKTGLPERLRQFARILKSQGISKLPGSGSLMIGSKGMLYSPGDYGGSYQLLPKEAFADYKRPEPWLPRLPGKEHIDKEHHLEWIAACKGGPPAMSNFDVAAFLTEIILLGNVAMRVGKKIEWDGKNMRSPNCPEAAGFVRREYRKGWVL